MTTIVVREWPTLVLNHAIARDEIAVWRIPLDDGRYPDSLSTLSADEIRRARRHAFDADRRRFSACRVALRAILASYLGIDSLEVVFTTRPDGKPLLDSDRHGSSLRFSVSHSHDLALIAVSSDRELGVDVEYVRPMPAADDVIARYFSAEERLALAAVPAHPRLRRFFHAWTLKEAYLKACGDGLTRPLDQVSITLTNCDGSPRLRVLDRPGDERLWILSVVDVGTAYAAAIAVERRDCHPPGDSIGY